MTPPSPSSQPAAARVAKRMASMACAAAGLYALLLGPVGALGQNESATPTSTPTSSATQTPTQAPTQAPTSEPTQEPTSAPTQESTPQSTPESTPESTPTGTPESTPTGTPESTPTGTPESTPTGTPEAGPTAGATPESKDKRPAYQQDVQIDAIDPAVRGPRPRDCKPSRKASSSTRELDPRCGALHVDDHGAPDASVRTKKIRRADGTPTLDNPTITMADVGAAPIGVPNFIIDKFRIPPFLLPIYQAAGMQYGIRWEILAAINEIETDYGRNLNVSSAGALGWMQFMPATWKAYGVDANYDGVKDPYNPVDAIFAAARYLRAAGAEQDIRRAIFAYNHADWYVDSVVMRARVIGGLPSNFVGSLTGLTQARFPVHAKARYANDLDEKDAKRRVAPGSNAAFEVSSDETRRGIKIFARRGAPVVAVNDGKILNIGRSERLGRFVQLQDVYGNVFTYAHLAKISETYPAPRPKRVTPEQIARELNLPSKDAAPKAAASRGDNRGAAAKRRSGKGGRRAAGRRGEDRDRRATRRRVVAREPVARPELPTKERLFANPTRPAARQAGGEVQLAEASYKPVPGAPLKLNPRDYQAKKLREGARVISGTVLGRIGRTSKRVAPHVLFEIRPAGRGAPRIDPKPILDGWKLLESTEIYRAAGRNPLFGPDAKAPSIGQILLMSKELLAERVLANPRIDIYACGRRDVRIGAIDRRVLATLEFLAASGLKPTVTSLKCGHGFYTASGSVSHHSSGNAVDIAAINGIPILGHQGQGSITELAVQRLITLQGTMRPDQIITLMTFEGADNTYAMGDHHDHIHVGWRPLYGTNTKAAKQVNAVLKPDQWIKLIDRLKEIDNPVVRRGPAEHVLRVDRDARRKVASGHRRASHAHDGE